MARKTKWGKPYNRNSHMDSNGLACPAGWAKPTETYMGFYPKFFNQETVPGVAVALELSGFIPVGLEPDQTSPVQTSLDQWQGKEKVPRA